MFCIATFLGPAQILSYCKLLGGGPQTSLDFSEMDLGTRLGGGGCYRCDIYVICTNHIYARTISMHEPGAQWRQCIVYRAPINMLVVLSVVIALASSNVGAALGKVGASRQ